MYILTLFLKPFNLSLLFYYQLLYTYTALHLCSSFYFFIFYFIVNIKGTGRDRILTDGNTSMGCVSSKRIEMTCLTSTALECFSDSVFDDETGIEFDDGGYSPPTNSALLVKAQREKLIHLHSTGKKAKESVCIAYMESTVD